MKSIWIVSAFNDFIGIIMFNLYMLQTLIDFLVKFYFLVIEFQYLLSIFIIILVPI